MEMGSKAESYFEQHCNCTQSVFAPYAEYFGMDLDTALKIATPFGGGMGHAGQICGAVSGGLLAIGLATGISVYDPEKKYACYALAKEFQDRFREIHGDTTCPGLLGYDIADPGELAKVRKLNLFHTRCVQFVRDAAFIVNELINEKGKSR